MEHAIITAAEERRKEVGQAMGAEHAAGLAIPDTQPAAVLLEHVDGARIARQTPMLQPGRDLSLGDEAVLVELGLRSARRQEHQEEANDGDQEDDRDRLEQPPDDVLGHSLPLASLEATWPLGGRIYAPGRGPVRSSSGPGTAERPGFATDYSRLRSVLMRAGEREGGGR